MNFDQSQQTGPRGPTRAPRARRSLEHGLGMSQRAGSAVAILLLVVLSAAPVVAQPEVFVSRQFTVQVTDPNNLGDGPASRQFTVQVEDPNDPLEGAASRQFTVDVADPNVFDIPASRAFSVLGMAVTNFQIVDSSGDAFALPVDGDVADQLVTLNAGPPQFDPDEWEPVFRWADNHVATAFDCNDVPDPLNEPYVDALYYIDDADEVTFDNCGSAFYRFAIVMPNWFTRIVFSGGANTDDVSRLFVNGQPVSPEMLADDPGGDRDVDGVAVLTWPLADELGTLDTSLFVAGENDLTFAVCGDCGPSEPTGLEFMAWLAYDDAPTGDLNHDGCVDLSDLAELLSTYGTASGAALEGGDTDGDGDVDLSDLAELLAHYGECQ